MPEIPSDCTDRDRSAADLRDQNSFLRQILDINPNLIFAKDREGRFTLVNKAVADIYGTTVENLIGKTDADFNKDAGQVAFFRRIDLKVMDSLEEVFIPEEVVTDASGKIHWLQTVKRPIIDADGVSRHVLGVATNITQRRELESQLRHAQKMEALGQLAGGIAHDFNNLLAVVLGNAERMLGKLHQQQVDATLLKEGLELIVSAGERAAMLVRQLLAFSRKQPFSPVLLDVNKTVADMKDLLQRLIGEHIELEVNLGLSVPTVRADPGQIEQVIVNLVVNARDAMPDGGRIVISTQCIDPGEGTIPGGAPASGPCALLTVADTGIGMSPQTQGRIFEPFFTTKEVHKGTGLGLSTVYGIVRQIGGHILVESEPGEGSTFKVLLLAADDLASPPATPGPSEIAGGTETILVCEDEEEVLKLACRILADHGYHALAANRPLHALEIARHHDGPIHLLLTDVVMPEMNGKALAEQIGNLRPRTKILYMTGYSPETLPAWSADETSVAWVGKPFSAEHLLKKIRAVLTA